MKISAVLKFKYVPKINVFTYNSKMTPTDLSNSIEWVKVSVN